MSDMNVQDDDRELVARTKACFDASVERLDAGTRARLAEARQQALRAAGRPAVYSWQSWLPVAGVAAAVALLAFLVRTPQPEVLALVPEPADEEVEVMITADQFEMIEDLDFYYWMDNLSANNSTH